MDLQDLTRRLSEKLEGYSSHIRPRVTGIVQQFNDDVVFAEGLSDVSYGELIKIGSSYAMVLNLEQNLVGAVVLNGSEGINAGDTVTATGHVMDIGAGFQLLGRVINPLGTPVDNKGGYGIETYLPLEAEAPPIIKRDKVNEPLQTGIMAIDSMIPIGKGQRQLIVGDRQTGKTAIAIDTILNQKDKDVICVYVAIGQKASTTARIVRLLEERNALSYTVIISSSADDSASMQYLAPYTGCAIAEYFMHKGKDVLIIYDDLTKHAIAYRTLTLLLKRPSGREAFPGDIFYTHSRLLERAAKLGKDYGGGSMTALPIIETQMGDIASYIPTNVISITDGQIFLDTELFNAGIRPAINVGLSVSRVGASAQYPAMKRVSGRLRLELASYRELASFSQFMSDLDPETTKVLKRGEMLSQGLKQSQYSPIPFEVQTVCLYILTNGLIDWDGNSPMEEYLKKITAYIKKARPGIFDAIKESRQLSDDAAADIEKAVREFTQNEKQ